MPGIFSETLKCETCGKEHAYDQVMGYDCLVLVDGRDRPNTAWAWCDEACLNHWLDSPNSKQLFPAM